METTSLRITFKDNLNNNLHKHIEDMINGKMKSLQEKFVSFCEKFQSIYNDELQTLKVTSATKQ